MSDISHGKAMSILEELGNTTGLGDEEFKNDYKQLRNEGYKREEAVRVIWRDVMSDYFSVLYDMDDGWTSSEEESFKSKVYWFFDEMYNITGVEISYIKNEYNSFLTRLDEIEALKSTWDVMMERYFEHLIGRDYSMGRY